MKFFDDDMYGEDPIFPVLVVDDEDVRLKHIHKHRQMEVVLTRQEIEEAVIEFAKLKGFTVQPGADVKFKIDYDDKIESASIQLRDRSRDSW